MKHDPHLANDLVVQSLIAQIAKLTARVDALEAGLKVRNRRVRRRGASMTQKQAAILKPILESAARMNGCTVAEICGSRGSKRAILGRSEACFEAQRAGLSIAEIGRGIGDRGKWTVSHLIARHKARMGIK